MRRQIAEHNGLTISVYKDERDKVGKCYQVHRRHYDTVTIPVDKVVKLPRHRRLLWLDLLVSGEYQQASGRLVKGESCDSTHRCCLGVISDACPTLICTYDSLKGAMRLRERGDSKGDTSFLTLGLLNWVGLTPGMQNFLADMNDAKYPFEDIAFTIDTIF